MFGVAITRGESHENFAFAAQAIFVAYHNADLDVKASVTKMPLQRDFFNMRPILIKAREHALKECSKYMESDTPKEGWADGWKSPRYHLKVVQEGKTLISQNVNSCIIIAMAEPKAGRIKPVFHFVGVDGYPEWATLYTALDKFLQVYDRKLADLDIELNNEGARAETISDEVVL